MSTAPVSSPGLAPALRRSLSLTQIVFLGWAYMAPMALFHTFGIVAEVS